MIYSAQDVLKPKPDPDIYIKAISTLGMTPEECLVIEDNENGIKAAKDSGAHVMVVKEVSEVNFINIKQKIDQINKKL